MVTTRPLAASRTTQSTAASRAKCTYGLYGVSIWTPGRKVRAIRARIAGKLRDCEPAAYLFGIRSSTTLFAVPVLERRKHDAELLDDTLHLGTRISSLEGGWIQVCDSLSRIPEQPRRAVIRQFGAAALLHDKSYPAEPNPFAEFERLTRATDAVAAGILSASMRHVALDKPSHHDKPSLPSVPSTANSSFSDDVSVVSSDTCMSPSSVASTARTYTLDHSTLDTGKPVALSFDPPKQAAPSFDPPKKVVSTFDPPKQVVAPSFTSVKQAASAFNSRKQATLSFDLGKQIALSLDLGKQVAVPSDTTSSEPLPPPTPATPAPQESSPQASAAAASLEEARAHLESLKLEVETLSSQQSKLGLVGIRRLCLARDQIPAAERNLADAQARFNRTNSGSLRLSQRLSVFGG